MKKDLKNILVPVDFKEPSVKALRFAANLAHRIQGEIFLLYVMDTPGLLADFFSSGDQLVKLTDRAKEKMQELSASIEELKGIPVRNRVERGNRAAACPRLTVYI